MIHRINQGSARPRTQPTTFTPDQGQFTGDMAGRGMANLILVTSVLTCIAWTAFAQQVEPPTLAPCSAFKTSGFFNDNRLQVQFLLYTPNNPTCGQFINQSGGIESSMFNASLDTKVIIHGFRVLGTKPSWTEKLVDALLGTGPENVVVIDWVTGSTAKYNQAVDNVPKLSMVLVDLLKQFLDLGSTLESFHLIGVSLGAHVAGHIGTYFGGRIGWITDFGIRIPVGHVDYFINGGRDQPGCPPVTNPYQYLICDHMRSVAVYISALRGNCPFIGFPCPTYKDFQNGLCVDCETQKLSSCPRLGRKESLIIPGEFIVHDLASESENYTSTISYKTQEPPKEIQLFLLTTPAEPYCAHHILLEFTLHEIKDVSITIEINLSSANSSASKTKISIPKQTQGGRALVAHGTRLCLLHKVEIRVTIRGFWRKAPEFRGNLCMAELPMDRRRSKICLPQTINFSGNSRQTFDVTEDQNFTCP
uniref:Phospholipase A1 member A n=1 Tax=Pyxicephalus adspersus TaxID=30357 RepID=A0AAV3B2Y5_PYXAD|nr:TPA: hypothetical protein GDO54_002170 [Pyxicephalus adspersus]